MRHCMVLMVSLAFIVSSYGQETGTIRGRVFDGETQRPLEAANVMLQGTRIGANTNKDGSFILSQVTAGPHLLRIS